MQMQLDQLISQGLEELKRLGMKKSTIKSYKYSAFSPVRSYCVRNGTTNYEPVLMDEFLSSQKERLENNEISKRHYRKLRRAVLILKDLSQHGNFQSGRYNTSSTYKINEYFSHHLKKFLESLNLSKGTIANQKTNILQFLNYIEDKRFYR